MQYDVVIVGGGIAGLTSAAFLCKDGYKVVVCEKEEKVGGLVNSFEYKGFIFDGGIRAIENSGIVHPMLRQLGLHVDFLDSNVTIGIQNEQVKLTSKDSLSDYKALLKSQFPENEKDIDAIIAEISLIMKHMDVLYGIDNPIFLDPKKDREYFMKKILPWMFKFIFTIGKITKLDTPIDIYMKKFTENQLLIDMIAQHFFQKTPAFFALSYFSLYLDYQYPKGGTGQLIDAMKDYIIQNHGEILTDTEIVKIDINAKQVLDANGKQYGYKKMIWASDLKKLYSLTDQETIKDEHAKKMLIDRRNELADLVGGDSIYTVYLTVDMDKSDFEKMCSAHTFYTPLKKGLSNAALSDIKIEHSENKNIYINDKQTIIEWIKKYYQYTTYEISIPVLRDPTLAPEGKTGLIVSALMEYSLVKHIYEMGWYDEFKQISQAAIIDILSASIFPKLKEKVIDQFSSTPLTIEKLTGNSDGAITGWAFTNKKIPVVHTLTKAAQSTVTPLADILQAGQWAYSPGGLPMSILTGKLAANSVKKQLRK